MADKLSPGYRSKNMAHIRAKGMKPEMKVRKVTHAMGYRYRLHRKNLPGSPDLVFPGRKKIIFVHGCFWHQHGSKDCKIARRPRSNLDYWEPKLDRNVNRDKENQKSLKAMGWEILVIWECQTKDDEDLKTRIDDFLKMTD